jgi:hypothetical protein
LWIWQGIWRVDIILCCFDFITILLGYHVLNYVGSSTMPSHYWLSLGRSFTHCKQILFLPITVIAKLLEANAQIYWWGWGTSGNSICTIRSTASVKRVRADSTDTRTLTNISVDEDARTYSGNLENSPFCHMAYLYSWSKSWVLTQDFLFCFKTDWSIHMPWIRLNAPNPSFPELEHVTKSFSLPRSSALAPSLLTCTCDSNAQGHLAALDLTGTGADRGAGGYWTAAQAGRVPFVPGHIWPRPMQLQRPTKTKSRCSGSKPEATPWLLRYGKYATFHIVAIPWAYQFFLFESGIQSFLSTSPVISVDPVFCNVSLGYCFSSLAFIIS